MTENNPLTKAYRVVHAVESFQNGEDTCYQIILKGDDIGPVDHVEGRSMAEMEQISGEQGERAQFIIPGALASQIIDRHSLEGVKGLEGTTIDFTIATEGDYEIAPDAECDTLPVMDSLRIIY